MRLKFIKNEFSTKTSLWYQQLFYLPSWPMAFFRGTRDILKALAEIVYCLHLNIEGYHQKGNVSNV